MVVCIAVCRRALVGASARNETVHPQGELEQKQVVISRTNIPGISSDSLQEHSGGLQLLVLSVRPSPVRHSVHVIPQKHRILNHVKVCPVGRALLLGVDEEGNGDLIATE